MSSKARRRADVGRLAGPALLAVALSLAAAGCAATVSTHTAERAERDGDYDLAVVEWTKVVRAHHDDRTSRLALDRARQRAAREHFFHGRRLAADQRFEEA